MKKITAIILLAMLLGGALAESGFTGLWQDPAYGRAVLQILPAGGEDQYDVTLTWGSSADSAAVWHMSAVSDGDTLSYTDGRMAEVTYDVKGDVASEDVYWEDATGALTLTTDGLLRWEDSREDRAAEFAFAPLFSEAPKAGELVTHFFKPVMDLEVGSAGYSLKLARAVYDVVRYCWVADLWNVEPDALEKNLTAAWEALGDERQGRFTENFGEIAALADEAFDSYDVSASVFIDADVGGQMADLVGDMATRLSWQTLRDRALALTSD